MRLSVKLLALFAAGMVILTLLVGWLEVNAERRDREAALQQHAESLAGHLQALRLDDSIGAILATVRDASGGAAAGTHVWRAVLLCVVAQCLWAFVTIGVVQSAVLRPITKTANWMRDLRAGKIGGAPGRRSLLGPISEQAVGLAESLVSARASAEEEARLRDVAESHWTAERLRAYVRRHLQGPLFVVSNREPYMHVRRGNSIEVVVPASGVVTALEPILRACKGTWIAHGSGNADRECVDRNDRLAVPPNQPAYALRRVWLTAEEEEGYYNGFSNEGLWPLCHIAHTRPLFRASDWMCYQTANRRFADAVLEEMAGVPDPLVLVQDYHFALVPRLIKDARPDAHVGVFWHIPWPNPDAFGICPWQREVLDGLLGADLIGFHTQAHCNNFLETVDRAFESQIGWERFTARRHGHLTHVRPFPISVDFSMSPGAAASGAIPEAAPADVLKRLGIASDFIGIGVDRLDYTKGILERFQAIERFFEKWGRYAGRFTFLQIGAPSRTNIARYQALAEEVMYEAARINDRFGTANWKPIVLVTRHHSHAEIESCFRVADLCLVTALHDGMNLVAKEFVAARGDEDGVLILSEFTGASRELTDALIVNPYDTEQVADAIRRALDMSETERRARMRRMRRIVREHNVYRWAATLIGQLADLRLETTEVPWAARTGRSHFARSA